MWPAATSGDGMMIELTPAQWHEIAGKENPILIEPETKTAYVVVPKDHYDRQRTNEIDAARVLRITWMRRMRLDEEEIAESLRDEPPTSVEEELKEIKALDHLDKITPPGDVLGKYAIQY
jgi:hypothetical protein